MIPTSESALPTLERYSYKAWFLLEVFVCAEWITCLCLVSAIKLGWVLGSFPETCSFLACLCVVSVCLVCVWSEPSSLAEFWGLSPRLAPSWRVCVWWVYDLFVLGQYPKACWVLRSFPETCSFSMCLCVVSELLVFVWSVPSSLTECWGLSQRLAPPQEFIFQRCYSHWCCDPGSNCHWSIHLCPRVRECLPVLSRTSVRAS